MVMFVIIFMSAPSYMHSKLVTSFSVAKQIASFQNTAWAPNPDPSINMGSATVIFVIIMMMMFVVILVVMVLLLLLVLLLHLVTLILFLGIFLITVNNLHHELEALQFLLSQVRSFAISHLLEPNHLHIEFFGPNSKTNTTGLVTC